MRVFVPYFKQKNTTAIVVLLDMAQMASFCTTQNLCVSTNTREITERKPRSKRFGEQILFMNV